MSLRGLAGAASICLTLPAAQAGSAGRLAINGTGAAQGTMKLLANAFAAQNPGVQVGVARSLGTTGDIRALMAGAIDIATSARPVIAEEQEAGLAALGSEKRKLHVLTLECVTPDTASVTNGSYRYAKALHLVTSPTISSVARAFVEFIRPDPGRAVLAQIATQPVTG